MNCRELNLNLCFACKSNRGPYGGCWAQAYYNEVSEQDYRVKTTFARWIDCRNKPDASRSNLHLWIYYCRAAITAKKPLLLNEFDRLSVLI